MKKRVENKHHCNCLGCLQVLFALIFLNFFVSYIIDYIANCCILHKILNFNIRLNYLLRNTSQLITDLSDFDMVLSWGVNWLALLFAHVFYASIYRLIDCYWKMILSWIVVAQSTNLSSQNFVPFWVTARMYWMRLPPWNFFGGFSLLYISVFTCVWICIFIWL